MSQDLDFNEAYATLLSVLDTESDPKQRRFIQMEIDKLNRARIDALRFARRVQERRRSIR